MNVSKASSPGTTLHGHAPFVLYFWARNASELSYQMAGVALGWQLYALTGSAFLLGVIGLVQFAPSAALFFLVGAVADRYDRRRVAQICQIVQAGTAALLAVANFDHRLGVTGIFVAVAAFGVASAFESAAVAALLPAVVPEERFQQGTAVSTGAFQVAAIAGPAAGGLLYALSPGAVYAAIACFYGVAALLNGAIRIVVPVKVKEQPTLESLFAGVRFVWRNRPILGAISLDLFAVLLGGATALLPIYARDILHTGPWGLGVLRGAPALGAVLMSVVLARHTLNAHVGRRMFYAVIVFGVATVIFAVSHLLWLSILALIVMGAADMVSMVVRIALVQLATPDDMRGRVGAVNYLFVDASNQLGQFESGLTAALFGAVPAAALGGIGTIAVAFIWMKVFPALTNLQRLDDHRPA
jgi:MFS family permease